METWVRSSPSDKADEVIPGSETEQVTCLSVLYSCPNQGLHCFGCSLVFLTFHFCVLYIFWTLCHMDSRQRLFIILQAASSLTQGTHIFLLYLGSTHQLLVFIFWPWKVYYISWFSTEFCAGWEVKLKFCFSARTYPICPEPFATGLFPKV